MSILDAVVQLVADGAGKAIDASEVVVAAVNTYRQRINISSPLDPAGHAEVMKKPIGTEYGLVTKNYMQDMAQTLRQMQKTISRNLGSAADPSSGRLRVFVDFTNATALTTVTTVGSVTNLTNFNGANSKTCMYYGEERGNWAVTTRGRFN